MNWITAWQEKGYALLKITEIKKPYLTNWGVAATITTTTTTIISIISIIPPIPANRLRAEYIA